MISILRKTLLIIFLSVWSISTHSIELPKCLLLWRASQKINFQPGQIDSDKLKQWLEQHPKKFKPLARWIEKHIKLHDYNEAVTEIVSNFNKFHDSLPENATVIFFSLGGKKPGPSIKSNFWLTGAIMEKVPKTRDYSVVTNASQLEDIVAPEIYVVIIDDASYSGSQLANVAQQVSRKIDSPNRIHVFTGFQTDTAKTRVQSYATFHPGKTIYTIKELLKKEPLVKRIYLKNLFIKAYNHMRNTTLDLFNHKTPDFISFPESIKNGKIPEKGIFNWLLLFQKRSKTTNNEKYIKFIKEAEPPYKKVTEKDL